jgi:hypothetical protein
VGRCQPSLDGRTGILYQCVKAQTSVLQLACPNDPFSCAGNTAQGACTVNTFSPSSCVFSSTAGRFVRITCDSTSVVTTSQPGRSLAGVEAGEEDGAEGEEAERRLLRLDDHDDDVAL